MTGAETRVPIPGSERAGWPGAREVGPAAGGATVDVSVWLRPRRGGELDRERAAQLGATLPAQRRYETRAALAATSGADPAAVAAVRAYLHEYGIEVVETRWRSLHARGTLAALSHAFGTKLSVWEEEDGLLQLRQRSGTLSVPANLVEIVQGVFGLDTWPVRHGIKPPAQAQPAQQNAEAPPPPLTAAELARVYEFPAGDGRGQTIGIVHFGAAFDRSGLEASLRPQGIAAPEVVLEYVDGSVAPTAPTPFDVELALDAHVTAMLAPGAKLVLYGAPHDERGALDVIAAALFDEQQRPSILSISYGWPQDAWTPNALELFDELFVAAALLGVSVFCASGDYGADVIEARPRAFAPASSPFAHACGGTQVDVVAGKRVEGSWSGSGGGFSERIGGVPGWQSAASEQARKRYARHGRGVPDVAAHAFPPAYGIVRGGRTALAGGTSAVAPLWSALTARLNERLGTPLGFYAPLLYAKAAEAALFRPATGEGNGYYLAPEGWPWNPCTGLGVPRGAALERALRAGENERSAN